MESQPKEKTIELLDFTAQSGWEKATACIAQIIRTSPKKKIYSNLISAKFPTQARNTLLRFIWYQSKYPENENEHAKSAAAAATEEQEKDKKSSNNTGEEDEELFPENSDLGLLFGLRKHEDYILVIPSDDNLTGNTALLVLSAISCAACECGVRCAFVVRYGKLSEADHVGYCPPGFRAAEKQYQGVHMATQLIRNAPGNLRYLDGLFELALKKFNAVSPVPRVNVQYTYIAEDALKKSWDSSAVNLSKQMLGHIPLLWGPDKDPVTSLRVSLQWSHREPLEDNEEFSQYSSGTASRWIMRGLFVQHMAEEECVLSKTLRTLLLSYIDSLPFDSISQIINIGQNTTVRITPASPSDATLSNIIPEEKDIQEMLDLIFEGVSAVWKEPSKSHSQNEQQQQQQQKKKVYKFKGAPIGSLLETFAMCLLSIRGLKGVLLIWKEFVRRLRSYTEKKVPIPGVGHKPDLSHCLLQQKLEMLNYAMNFEPIVSDESEIKKRAGGGNNSDSTSSLFEYVESSDLTASAGDGWGFDDEDLVVPDIPNDNLSEAGAKELNLLVCGEPLVIPPVQDIGVQTEDMIADLENLLMGVGPGREGSLMRARLQSPQVISDMQAFKAANPHGELADFVRWYSPSDWIGGRVGGHLSERMSVPGNTWVDLWAEAKPCPAAEQRPLFDKKTETAKALHYLETLRPSELLEQLITVALSGFLNLFAADNADSQTIEGSPHIYGSCPHMRPVLDALYQAVNTFWVHSLPSVTRAGCEKVWRAANEVEWYAARITSLVAKLGPSCLRVADAVAGEGYCSLETFNERMSATFSVYGKDSLPPVPNIREYIITLRSKRSGCRLYAFASNYDYPGYPASGSGETVRLACCTSNEFQSFPKGMN